MEKRGQAAMEFLMTYGWAILAAIIAIAVLAYFGVFNPGRYTTETCAVSAPFVCDDNSAATVANGISLVLRNGGDEDYNIKTIKVTNCDTTGEDFTDGAPPETANGILVASGTSGTLTVGCTSALTLDASFRGNIEVIYRKVGGTRDLISTGSIVRKKVTA